jgi:hypothetical protein
MRNDMLRKEVQKKEAGRQQPIDGFVVSERWPVVGVMDGRG